MSSLKVSGPFVAVKQLVVPEVKQEKVRGLDLSNKFTRNLIQSEVVIGSDDYSAGDILYFKADNSKVPANLMIYDVEQDGKTLSFVLLPKDYVVLVKE